MNVEPLLALISIKMRPPWTSTIFLMMAWLTPARFSTRLDYLKGGHWTRTVLGRMFSRQE
jgi:hypothetical protein